MAVINEVRRFYTELRSHNGNILYEVECLGMVWYEIHFYKNTRIQRDYNYFTAIKQFNQL